MSKMMKIILISVTAAVLAAAIGIGIYFLVRDNTNPEADDPKYELDGSDDQHTKLY